MFVNCDPSVGTGGSEAHKERADRSGNRENLPLAARFPHHLPRSPVFLVEQEECKDVQCGI